MLPPTIETLPLAVQQPPFRTLYELWHAACRPGRLPSRQDFDPTALPPRLLAQILLFDCVPAGEGWRFRFRVAGTAFHDLIGIEATGRFLDEIAPPERAQPVQSALEAIVTTGRPVYLAGRLTLVNRDYVRVCRLGLPLAQDGEHVDMVLAIFAAIPRDLEDVLFGRLTEPRDEERILL
jgi:hypothetical protein